ncbi:DUF86 domain-containing protein [Parasediminibacterium paludis]|uniref:DUF86 domain-containing protein n=1 Tax=Parasediminibacterium paludis TaxID=908966 RepID=A0ABV8PZ84_9BACT
MSKREVALIANDMLECCNSIFEYIKGFDFNAFANDKKTVDAVVRNLEILGEASRMMTNEIKSDYPEVEWKILNDLRNRCIHDYFGIDYEIIWDIIQNYLPEQADFIEQLSRKLSK